MFTVKSILLRALQPKGSINPWLPGLQGSPENGRASHCGKEPLTGYWDPVGILSAGRIFIIIDCKEVRIAAIFHIP
jgi:hypothetical protein